MLFSSGMAAISTALFAVLKSGDHVVCIQFICLWFQILFVPRGTLRPFTIPFHFRQSWTSLSLSSLQVMLGCKWQLFNYFNIYSTFQAFLKLSQEISKMHVK